MTTPKSLRSAPPRRFENYTLFRTVSKDVGLVQVPDSAFTTILTGGLDDTVTGFIDLGFNFSFDNITYNRLVACANGWMILVGPTETSVSTITGNMFLSGTYSNEGINLTNNSQNVLLAPWFDDLKLVSDQLTISGSSDTQRRISEGLEPASSAFNQVEFGVKLFYDQRSSKGRRTVVRWNAISDKDGSASKLKFDVAVYENGTIEFCYPPKQSTSQLDTLMSGTTVQDATCGIFMPGTNRFRDFAKGLGYLDDKRQTYQYGGASYDSSFFDTGIESAASGSFVSRQYVWRLRPTINWPAPDYAGSKFVFSPPVNRRQVLPRLEIKIKDSLQSNYSSTKPVSSVGFSTFDDRKSIAFTSIGTSPSGQTTGTIVNFPTTLPRFYSDSNAAAVTRQNLFTGDFQITGSIVKSSLDQFIDSRVATVVPPFSENKSFENDPSATTDAFFISGSNITQLGDALKQPVRSKTQIKLSLPVQYSTKMFGISSSIYYYNVKSNGWLVPRNSSYTSVKPGQIGTVDEPPTGTTKGDIGSAAQDSLNKLVIEDHRGFGPIGNVIVSGSSAKGVSFGVSSQSDTLINSTYNADNVSVALSRGYDKSVAVNDDYSAIDDEKLRLPINLPFLIERAVIEFPIAAGNGWFSDKTTCFQPLETLTGSFDFGGPALTVALFNQHTLGDSGRTSRDLIMSGTITHSLDNVSEIVFSNVPSVDSTYQIRPRGYLAFDKSPGAIITPLSSSSGYNFTGSVAVKCEAQVTNGVITRLTRLMTFATANTNRQGVIDTLSSPELSLTSQVGSTFEQRSKIAYINNYGRGSTGFKPSGRSAFGKEHSSNSLKSRVPNPFYMPGAPLTVSTVTSGSLNQQVIAAIQGGSNFTVQAAIPLATSSPSPYVVYPGDNLILAVSKTRPVFFGNIAGQPTSGSIVHDVVLLTGSINITLYGSVLQNNKEWHDTLAQNLNSDAIHESIAAEPIYDRFNSEYSEKYVGGTYDDIITGSLIVKTIKTDGTLVLSASSRGRVASRVNARSSGNVSSNLLSVNSQPWYEKAGSLRVLGVQDSSERYWDSMMPNINDCFKADGASIWTISPGITDPNIFGNDSSTDKSNTGYMFFDVECTTAPFDLGGSTNALQDGNWTKAYPFEPRYASIPRQLNSTSRFVATRTLSSSAGSLSTRQIEPQTVRSFFFGPLHYQFVFFLMSDINTTNRTVSNEFLTGSATPDDSARALFGFGDGNYCTTYANFRVGTNHFVETRNTAGKFQGSSTTIFGQGPIVRGWKYGVHSGLATFSKAYFSQKRYGQFRDMLEQRPYTRYYNVYSNATGPAVVTVKFVDSTGKLTKPENTFSQNLSFEATSSVPYVDGETRNRSNPNLNTLNASILSFNASQFGDITV